MNHTPRVDRSLQGIGLCTLGYAFLALQDAAIKWLVADYSVITVLFWRGLVVVAACLLAGRLRLVRRAWRSPSRRLLVVRGLLSIVAWLLYYTAARDLTLAEMTTLYFSAPIMVTVLAALIEPDELLPITSVPALTVVVPVYVFAPVKMVSPAPAWS